MREAKSSEPGWPKKPEWIGSTLWLNNETREYCSLKLHQKIIKQRSERYWFPPAGPPSLKDWISSERAGESSITRFLKKARVASWPSHGVTWAINVSRFLSARKFFFQLKSFLLNNRSTTCNAFSFAFPIHLSRRRLRIGQANGRHGGGRKAQKLIWVLFLRLFCFQLTRYWHFYRLRNYSTCAAMSKELCISQDSPMRVSKREREKNCQRQQTAQHVEHDIDFSL